MAAPNFHFLDPLQQIPGAELDTLLGRFVLDRWNPTVAGFQPRDPSRIITPDFLQTDLEFANAELYIAAVQKSSTSVAAAKKALAVRRAAEHEGDVVLSAVKVIRKSLRSAPDAFNPLMADADVKQSVLEMMRGASPRARRVWMVTAVLYTDGNGHIRTNATRSTEMNSEAKLTVPKETIAAATLAATHGGTAVAPEEDVDLVEVSARREKSSGTGMEADLSGKRVFAVQYWRCDDSRFVDRRRGKMTLRGRGLEKVETGHKGLGESDDEGEDSDGDEEEQQLVLNGCEELID
jgi:hypothetical protein